MKKVGFLGGSFDPIHFGHISMAVAILEKYHLDEILFCPAFCSPFKTSAPPKASAEHRFEMLKLALDHPQFKLTSIELDRKGPSYTIETLQALKDPNIQYRLIVAGEDALYLNQWKMAEELLKIAPTLIGKKSFPISSTEIRERLKKGLYCGHLAPRIVLEYIKENGLYSSHF